MPVTGIDGDGTFPVFGHDRRGEYYCPGVADLPDDLRRRLDDLFRSDRVATRLGTELLHWHPGHATVSTVVDNPDANFMGVIHGGTLFTLADIALSFASNGHGRIALAIQVDIAYHRGVTPGDEVIATATETSRTRRIANHHLELHVGEELVGSATGITYRTDEWHFGSDSWPEEWRANH